jgi:cysteine-S-conjugate beta-lyase
VPADLQARHLETTLLRGPFDVPPHFSALTEGVHRASTVTFDGLDAFSNRRERFLDGYTYGLAGTPTHYALAARLAALEGAAHVALAPSGLAAIHLVNQSLLSHGDHVLVADSVYGPTRSNAREVLARCGVDVEFYDPLVGGGIASLLRPETRLVWCESPGSLTLEVQDVPAIVAACRARGVRVALDNTWASPLGFRAIAHGVDLSVQALTKHVAGHGDLLLGSIATNDPSLYGCLRQTANLTGANVSPDDCALAMRGMATLPVRLQAQSRSALAVARWLRAHPLVDWLAFPPLPGDAGHALWARDFDACGALMSLTLRSADWDSVRRFADALRIFRIGASFGGVHSRVAAYREIGERTVARAPRPRNLIRLSIGLEHQDDLVADLSTALDAARGGEPETRLETRHASQQA